MINNINAIMLKLTDFISDIQLIGSTAGITESRFTTEWNMLKLKTMFTKIQSLTI